MANIIDLISENIWIWVGLILIVIGFSLMISNPNLPELAIELKILFSFLFGFNLTTLGLIINKINKK